MTVPIARRPYLKQVGVHRVALHEVVQRVERLLARLIVRARQDAEEAVKAAQLHEVRVVVDEAEGRAEDERNVALLLGGRVRGDLQFEEEVKYTEIGMRNTNTSDMT